MDACIDERPEGTVRPLAGGTCRRSGRWWRTGRLRLELRRCVTWAWLLPAAGATAVLAVLAASGTPAADRPFATRQALELGLPLVGVFLAVPLLEREWAHGALAQVALREPLARLLLVRLLLSMAYLAALAATVALVGLVGAPPGATGTGAGRWVAATVLIALAPTLVLATLGLLTTHLTGSAVSGYLVAIAGWLASLAAGLALPPPSDVRTFLLFSWGFPTEPGGWVGGKLLLLLVAALLVALQLPLLRREARLMRHTGE